MLEKRGYLSLTAAEEDSILAGVIPNRIAEQWTDVSLAELQRVVDNQREEKGIPNGCTRSDPPRC